jgi:RNA 2',3'-cyclic 3'-phosphodiesterase
MTSATLSNSTNDEIRSFLALDLPGQISDFLENVSNELKKSRADVRWVNPKSIHLTIKFLGNIDRAAICEIETVLKPIFAEQTPIQLRVSNVGVFPNPRQPRIIWAGIEDPTGCIMRIVPIIEDAFFKIGFAKESRPFTPHLTLGRSRSAEGRERLISAMSALKFDGPVFAIHRAILFQSVLNPAGANYSALSVFQLGESI